MDYNVGEIIDGPNVTVSGTITVLPKERSNVSGTISVTLSGTVSVTPNLLVPITTLNHYVTAIASPNGASLQTLTISHFVPHVTKYSIQYLSYCLSKHFSRCCMH